LDELKDLPHKVGLIRQNVYDLGVEPVLEEGNQLGTNPVPGDRDIGVGLVVDVRHPGFGKKRPQLVPPARQEGANQHPVSRVHGRQTLQAGAPREPQEERLGLVVARVAQCDRMSCKKCPSAFEERVSRNAGRRFHGPPFEPGTNRDILPFDADRPANRFRKPFTEPLVFVGRASQLMIEMGETDDAKPPFGLKVAQDVRQRNGIGSARQGDDDVGIAIGELMPADELSDAIEQLHHCRLGRQEGLERLEGRSVRWH
jgi:hypothetical protein